MSFLEIYYSPRDSPRKKQVRIISLEQVLGEHLRMIELSEDIKTEFQKLASEKPDKFHFAKGNHFTVIGPNGSAITYGNNGKSPWFLLRGIKDEKKQIIMLMIAKSVWGMEISQGLRMKKSIEKFGKEKIKDYLHQQFASMIEKPEIWRDIQGYCI